MYGIVAIIFTIILSITHYKLSTTNQQPYIYNELSLQKHLTTDQYEVFADCIDKQSLALKLNLTNPFFDLKISSSQTNNILSYAIVFDSNPLIHCQQITYALDFTNLKLQQQSSANNNQQNTENNIKYAEKNEKNELKFDKITMLKALLGKTEIVSLNHFQQQIQNQQSQKLLNEYKVQNNKQFIQVLVIKEKQQLSHKQEAINLYLYVQNTPYIEQLLQCAFWFSWFNLIAISLISYYRKNVFNQKVHLLTSLAILIYLIWISLTDQPSYQTLAEELQVLMIAGLLLLCVKVKLNLPETVLIICLAVTNQYVIGMDFNVKMKWFIFVINLFNLSTIYFGQNHETVHFALFSFLIQYGLVNPQVDITNPFILSLILVNLIFGPTIYELLQLRQDFTIKVKKTQQRLQSFEVSQRDHLFIVN